MHVTCMLLLKVVCVMSVRVRTCNLVERLVRKSNKLAHFMYICTYRMQNAHSHIHYVPNLCWLKDCSPRLSYGCAQVHNGYFVDLFVRKSNKLAIDMYEKFGYIKYREVGGVESEGRG